MALGSLVGDVQDLVRISTIREYLNYTRSTYKIVPNRDDIFSIDTRLCTHKVLHITNQRLGSNLRRLHRHPAAMDALRLQRRLQCAHTHRYRLLRDSAARGPCSRFDSHLPHFPPFSPKKQKLIAQICPAEITVAGPREATTRGRPAAPGQCHHAQTTGRSSPPHARTPGGARLRDSRQDARRQATTRQTLGIVAEQLAAIQSAAAPPRVGSAGLLTSGAPSSWPAVQSATALRASSAMSETTRSPQLPSPPSPETYARTASSCCEVAGGEAAPLPQAAQQAGRGEYLGASTDLFPSAFRPTEVEVCVCAMRLFCSW